MSSLGDLLLAHGRSSRDENVSDKKDSNNGHVTDIEQETSQDVTQTSFSPSSHKVFPERIEKNNADTQSNASSTDDYVRELLDPDDRPKNVWHVVEGPKSVPSQRDEHSEEDITSQDNGQLRDNTERDQGLDRHDLDHVPNEGRDHDLNRDLDRESEQIPVKSRDREREREKDRHSSRSRDEERDRGDRDRKRNRDRDHNKDRARDRAHGSSRDEGKTRDEDSHRHKSRRSHRRHEDDESDRYRSRHRPSRSRRSRSRSKTSSRRRDRSRSGSQSPITKRNSRTVLIMQLNPRVTSRDLEEFFGHIGRVKEVRLIMDSKTRRHKGIAYIEFEDANTASKAFALNGRDFFGAPIVIQSALMDRNRPSSDWHSYSSQSTNHKSTHSSSRSNLPPNSYRVYVGGLHVDITEDMLRSVFEPFGPILRLELMRDRVTNISRGYAFITYANIEDGQSAVQALDGLELGEKAIRVSKSTDKSERDRERD